jgi:hypothetical protein
MRHSYLNRDFRGWKDSRPVGPPDRHHTPLSWLWKAVGGFLHSSWSGRPLRRMTLAVLTE